MTEFHWGLKTAYELALRSPDPSTQNGAVIYPADGGMAVGWNGPTLGIHYDPDMPRDERMVITEHAERAAVYDAAKQGLKTDGATMVCPWASCAECARSIVSSGISLLVRHAEIMERTPERWRASIAAAEEILVAGGVEIMDISTTLGVAAIRHNGELWSP